MKELKIGLIGLGFMGTTHFRIYKGLKNARIAGIADIDPAKLSGDISKVVGNIGGGDNSVPLELAGIKTCASGMDLINDPEIDMVDICVPTCDHQKIAIAALEKGKHVFCEKPVCRSICELNKLLEVARKSEPFFNVGMCIRAWPEYRHTRELYLSGKLGRLRSASFRRLSPDISGNSWENWFMDGEKSGAAILDLHLHDTDFVRHIFGRPLQVSSFGAKGIRSTGIDHVMTSYGYEDNALVVAEGGWGANKKVPFEMSFQIICEKATVRLAGEGYKIYWEDGRIESPEIADPALPTGWHQELAYFVDCVQKGTPPRKYQTLDDVADSLKIVMAEIESVETKKSIRIKY
ncbi:MAG: hypothetical protein A2X49_06700 [Lentisphaerae bacterium GWF2_52_8]|nr:MAG: hypothetical protein A2X49_06700 [Lentisphaerae bacterium GWF2_52_8]